jgi:hypothetical protein
LPRRCPASITRASELYIRALAQGPVDRDVYSNLIAALTELGRIDEAHRHATAWLQALPADIEAMAFRGPARGGVRQCHRGVEVVRLSPASSRATRCTPPAAYAMAWTSSTGRWKALCWGMTGWKCRRRITRPGITRSCASDRTSTMPKEGR